METSWSKMSRQAVCIVLKCGSTQLCNDFCNALPPDIAVSVFDGPVQPKLTKFPLSPFGKENRAFSSTDYDRYPFIEYSVSSDKVFCFACRFFPPSFGNAEDVFVQTGFREWKNVVTFTET